MDFVASRFTVFMYGLCHTCLLPTLSRLSLSRLSKYPSLVVQLDTYIHIIYNIIYIFIYILYYNFLLGLQQLPFQKLLSVRTVRFVRFNPFFVLLTRYIFFLHDEKITPMGGVEKKDGGRERLRRRDYHCLYGLFTVFSYELRVGAQHFAPNRTPAHSPRNGTLNF